VYGRDLQNLGMVLKHGIPVEELEDEVDDGRRWRGTESYV
jgi:hypothetical protein